MSIPTPFGALVTIDILGAYAPAHQEQKAPFWDSLFGYVHPLATRTIDCADRHLIIAGDWNSYIDLERDIYRTDSPDLSSPTSAPVQYLTGFLADLRANDSPLFDPIARDKLTAIHDFTFSTRNHCYRSIPDKLFTSFPPSHCEPSTILDWTATRSLGLSDHRPICTRISLARLCQGWIEYPSKPLTRQRIVIDTKALLPEDETALHQAVSSWRGALLPPLATWLLQDPLPGDLATTDDLTDLHSELCKLFVEIPATVYTTGQHTRGHHIYKSRTAGQTQSVLCWLQHYKLSLADLYAAKVRGALSLSKQARRAARLTRKHFYTNTTIRTSLPTIVSPFSTRLPNWTLTALTSHRQEVHDLHAEWKKLYDHELYNSKVDFKKRQLDEIAHSPFNSTTRRKHHLGGKSFGAPLPCIMKDPADPERLLTGSAVNEMWGSSATATRPNTMPATSTEPDVPPWLDPALWTQTRESVAPFEAALMAPFSNSEIQRFLTHTGQSSPGTDGVQYNVLRHMCLHPSAASLNLLSILRRFLNLLLAQRQIPPCMKNAMLTFIHKAGDPLKYGNYRGISLLSCLFKVITCTLNGRLQTILHEQAGLDHNQGANRKGIHAAHKAAVVLNIIADAKLHNKPLHIIYTDIKGAFPSVPYQAFTDALTALGLGNSFLALIVNTQTDFTCIAKGPTGYSSSHPKANGVHEGDCLSPTLFCLVLNMYFHWLRSSDLGYTMQSAQPTCPALEIQIPVNGYADDMALIGNSHAEAQQILAMLDRFLTYYGMALNPLKCAYQYRTNDPLYRPPTPTCSWGDIPTYHGRKSYKYLGYFINMQLDFHYQYDIMAQKLEEACTRFYGKTHISLREAITYVNSDLISKLRYRMYLIRFPKTYLDKFETSCVKVVKRLAHLARSTATDLLISQGLYNIHNLQNCVRAEFLQNCLQAVDNPCRLTSQISYTHLKHTACRGLAPFSYRGLQTATWSDSAFSPIFSGVSDHLRTLDLALLVTFDIKADLGSKDIAATLAPLAYERLDDLASAGITRLHIIRLFNNLSAANITTLDDLSPHFDNPISPTALPPWFRLRNRAPRTTTDILNRYAPTRILHTFFQLPGASVKQRKALRILLHLHLERLLRSHSSYACPENTETLTHWGRYRKHSLNITEAYPDGSATKDNTRAGFGVHFPDHPSLDLVSRIPGHQTIARAEAYGVLATLMVTRLDTNLSIHCDRAPLVDQINRFILTPPQSHEHIHLPDRSLLLRILHQISQRTGTTTVTHVKAHTRDAISGSRTGAALSTSTVPLHQERNKTADKLAKSSLSLAHSALAVPPVETTFLSAVNVVLPQTVAPSCTHGTLFENKPLRLYLRSYALEYTLQYHLRGEWHTHIYAPTIWQAPILSSLSKQKNACDTKFLVQILGRTLPTFHRLHVIRSRLYEDETCVLCTAGSPESIEHILFQCPHYATHRRTLLLDLVSLCRSCPSLGSLSRTTVSSYLLNTVLSPPPEEQRNFSAGQLPIALFHWLSSHLPSAAATLRLGTSIHNLLLGSYKSFWRARCDAIKDRHLLFRDRLRAFPTSKPLHEMLEDDFLAFAKNWQELHGPPRTAVSPSASRGAPTTRPDVPASTPRSPRTATLFPHQGSSSSISVPFSAQVIGPFLHGPSPALPLPIFPTTHPVFTGQLRISTVAGDGNCLFRALLRAQGRDDSTHAQLRQACITDVLANWQDQTHALNAVHHDTPVFALADNEPFPTPAHYSAYFSTPGSFGTEVEAFVCAKILQRPLLIWSATTGLPLHPIFNYSAAASPLAHQTLHLSFTGNHYDALIIPDAALSAQLTAQVLQQAPSQPPARVPSGSAPLPPSPSPSTTEPASTPVAILSRRRRRTAQSTYSAPTPASFQPCARRRRLTQSSYVPIPAAAVSLRPHQNSLHPSPSLRTPSASLSSHYPPAALNTPPPPVNVSTVAQPVKPGPSPARLKRSHPPLVPTSRAILPPRRSLRIRSRTELRWGTTGHRTKRRRLVC